jgi:hypothetical protein
MITLTIRNNLSQPHIVVVGGLHGNEILGLEVYKKIATDPIRFHNLTVIIPNIEAYVSQTRFVDEDMNRSFPGNSEGNYEQSLAAFMMPILKTADYVIDIHTTTSPEFTEAAIMGPLTTRNSMILKAFKVKNAVIMEPSILKTSLIGNTNDGVSIEYGINYVNEHSIVDQILESIYSLQNPKPTLDMHQTTTFYDAEKLIPTSFTGELKNFEYDSKLNGYPFIVDEKNYTTYRGFKVINRRTIELSSKN